MHAQSSIKRETFSKETDIKYFKLLNKYTFKARNMTISSAFHCFPTISVIHNKTKNTNLCNESNLSQLTKLSNINESDTSLEMFS